jgi:hypothetical protein
VRRDLQQRRLEFVGRPRPEEREPLIDLPAEQLENVPYARLPRREERLPSRSGLVHAYRISRKVGFE